MKFVLFITNILLASALLASNSSSSLDTAKTISISNIVIIGNDVTEEDIILRELDFSTGEKVSEYQLNYNRERVYSLGIFNDVRFSLSELNGENILEIRVDESWYIYPLPYLTLRENSFKRSTYGLGVLYKNFRGRNETLWGLVTFGYDPTYSLFYLNPQLIEGEKITFGLSMGYTDVANRSPEAEIINSEAFSYNYIYGSVSFGYRFNQFNTLTQSSIFEFVEVPEGVQSLSASKNTIDRIFSLGLVYEFDNRNLKQFSNDGIFGTLQYMRKGLGINDISYNILQLDIRKYNLLYGDLSGKWRGVFRNTFGSSIPFYALSILGDDEYIRGHRFNRREGHNYLLTSFELNYPIIKEWNVSLDLPLLPKKLTSARIGLYTNLFVDSGLTFDNGEPLKFNELDTGWGFGVTLLVLPYNAIRFEYAFNELKKGEFILESGFSF